MAEAFLQLSVRDQRDALEFAAAAGGRPVHLLEKDVWVVWALATLFSSPIAKHLVFKGGTSLSKVYAAIRRFSEDIDLTYDIRELIPDLIGDRGEALPPNRSQEKRWTHEVRARLPQWIAETVVPELRKAIDREHLPATLRSEEEKVFIDYERLVAGSGYVSPSVMLEFGARSTGEPSEVRRIGCDAADHLKTLTFPEASPRVMRAERTFWEKATAVHVFCLQRRLRGDRVARHWHDLIRLDDAGYADAALRDRELALAVARHKAMFFAEKDAEGRAIDYTAAVTGNICLVPEGAAQEALADDYRRMVDDGLLLDDEEAFEVLIERCRSLERKANA
ncbi:nucleotidyl transferase AbiEii/AbiGii toxin family protein [Shumkonia mesophila]|uniref:nucleotidyl transferase AbiEii/AbiGii toxin family protein n=1 Tax=Shumkonia mesophila TaxID=2838854 RepID=UPI002934A84A|nr:nucleotidyl transferase AbiEii/AbiGii toxin family protein [Shumkonia mesophila]